MNSTISGVKKGLEPLYCETLLERAATPSLALQDRASLEALKHVAHSASLQFISNPGLFSWDLMMSPVVQQLKGDSAYGPTFELLEIMLTGGLLDFKKGDFSAVLSKAEITHDECVDKVCVCVCARARALDHREA